MPPQPNSPFNKFAKEIQLLIAPCDKDSALINEPQLKTNLSTGKLTCKLLFVTSAEPWSFHFVERVFQRQPLRLQLMNWAQVKSLQESLRNASSLTRVCFKQLPLHSLVWLAKDKASLLSVYISCFVSSKASGKFVCISNKIHDSQMLSNTKPYSY